MHLVVNAFWLLVGIRFDISVRLCALKKQLVGVEMLLYKKKTKITI